MLMENPALPSPAQSLAREHEAAILSAVSEQYGLPVEELRLLAEESFESEEEPGSFCFTILHASGLYGVYVPKDEQGHLTRFVATAL
jgi:hypothetical protein